jgi:hypothetical protein
MHLIGDQANADGDPAADGQNPDTVGRCNVGSVAGNMLQKLIQKE